MEFPTSSEMGRERWSLSHGRRDEKETVSFLIEKQNGKAQEASFFGGIRLPTFDCSPLSGRKQLFRQEGSVSPSQKTKTKGLSYQSNFKKTFAFKFQVSNESKWSLGLR